MTFTAVRRLGAFGISWRFAVFLLIAGLLLAPAIWNGYPLIYYDTEDYVEMSFTFQPVIYRIMGYGMLCTVARLFGSLWALAAVHALLTSYVLHEAVVGFVGRWRNLVFLVVGLAVCLFTGLPWVASQLLADVFAGVAILGIATLAFGDGLPPWRRRWLAAVTALAISVHMSHVAVAAGLLMVLVAMWAAARWLRRMPRPRMVLVSLAIASGIVAVPATHFLATGRVFFSEAGHVLQLALFVQNGLAKRYLDEVCPNGAQLKLCAHKEELPYTADEFLWGDSPFDELGGWKAMHDEADEIVAGAIRMFPLDVARAGFDNTVEQLDSVATGEDLVPMTWHFVKTQLKRYPKEFRQFRFAKQQRRPGLDFDLINSVHVPIAQAAELACIGLLLFTWRRRDRTSTGLAMLVLIALLGNAIVCGAISNPHDRYQNRVVWLALFASVICAVRLDQRFSTWRRAIAAENEALAAEATQSLPGSTRPSQSQTGSGKDDNTLANA
ncbi:MAG: hypothetical protein ACM31L_10305 [Actinomycetota bacterium]